MAPSFCHCTTRAVSCAAERISTTNASVVDRHTLCLDGAGKKNRTAQGDTYNVQSFVMLRTRMWCTWFLKTIGGVPELSIPNHRWPFLSAIASGAVCTGVPNSNARLCSLQEKIQDTMLQYVKTETIRHCSLVDVAELYVTGTYYFALCLPWQRKRRHSALFTTKEATQRAGPREATRFCTPSPEIDAPAL